MQMRARTSATEKRNKITFNIQSEAINCMPNREERMRSPQENTKNNTYTNSKTINGKRVRGWSDRALMVMAKWAINKTIYNTGRSGFVGVCVCVFVCVLVFGAPRA